MKKQFLFALPLMAVLILAGCGNKTTNDTSTPPAPDAAVEESQDNTMAEAPMDGELMVNLDSSILRWEGAKKVGGAHDGTVRLSSGSLTMEAGKLTGGTFVINMDSIENADLEGAPAESLVDHLKSADFFDVPSFPEASFTITGVEEGIASEVQITGDLTIKGVTNEVVFPAVLSQKDGAWVGKGVIELDRTRWDIRYGSGKFFKGLGDKVINDTMTIEVELMTK